MSSGMIGRLRHRVVLQRPVRSSGEGGTATISWENFGTAYAAIEAVSGSEMERSDGLSAKAAHRLTLRYRAGIVPDARIVSDGRIFEIRAALDIDGRKRWIQCLCEETLP